MAGVEGYMQSFVMLNVFMNLPGWLESEGINFLVMLNIFINLPAWPESDIINFVGYLLKTPPSWGSLFELWVACRQVFAFSCVSPSQSF